MGRDMSLSTRPEPDCRSNNWSSTSGSAAGRAGRLHSPSCRPAASGGVRQIDGRSGAERKNQSASSLNGRNTGLIYGLLIECQFPKILASGRSRGVPPRSAPGVFCLTTGERKPPGGEVGVSRFACSDCPDRCLPLRSRTMTESSDLRICVKDRCAGPGTTTGLWRRLIRPPSAASGESIRTAWMPASGPPPPIGSNPAPADLGRREPGQEHCCPPVLPEPWK